MHFSSHDQQPALQVHNLTVMYGEKTALWEVDLDLPSGTCIGIMGPNGSGKSTLLKTAMGLLDPASGYVRFFGKPLAEARKMISYVPQKESVDWDFPITVKEVVRMGRYSNGKLLGRLSKLDKELAEEAMVKLNISDLRDRHISQLSGGQQQRVFLARSLAQDAQLYFMDEPFTGVDAATEKTIVNLIKSLTNEGKTVIMVHHDLSTARAYFQHLVLLNTRLIAAGATGDVFTAQHIKQAFGGQLDILAEITNKIAKEDLPVRERGKQSD